MFFGLLLILGDLVDQPIVPYTIVLGAVVALAIHSDYSRLSRRIESAERFLATQSRRIVQRGPCEEKTPMLHLDSTPEDWEAFLEFNLNRIVGERHPKTSRAHHDHVRDLIADELTQSGWTVRLERVTGPYGIGHNVIAEKGNPNPNAEIIIVGAHYDTVQGSPGADDNGIAVAGILALGQSLSHYSFEKTVRLVAWDLEERQRWGRCLIGSRTMAKNCRQAGEKIAGVVCLEMIGMCDSNEGSQSMVPGMKWVAPKLYQVVQSRGCRADFIAIVANKPAIKLSQTIAEECANAALPNVQLVNSGLVKLIRDLRRSDHAPFWDAGIPALMLTDTSNFRSPFYHTALDRSEMIDFKFAAKTVRACEQAIIKIAGGSQNAHH